MKIDHPRNTNVYVQINTSSKNVHMEYIKVLNDKKTLCVRATQDFQQKNISNTPHYWPFQTDGVFFNDAPDVVSKIVTENLLPSVFQGTNVTFIGFGQTGAGKSSTMHGLYGSYKNRGFSIRILEELLEYKNVWSDIYAVDLEVSCVEVQKDFVIDLLTDENKIYRPFKNVTRLPVNSMEDAYTYLFFSEIKRSCYLTNSYISHCKPSIFTIYVKNYSTVSCNPSTAFSKINIVDFSAADTVGNTTCLYKTKREIGESNLNKTQLERLLLYFNKFQVRDDKILRGWGCLVEYLSDSLKPQNILRFVAHIFPTKENLPITISHLRFIQLALTISSAKVSKCSKPTTRPDDYQKLLQDYVQQENLRTMLLDEDGSIHPTKERTEQLKTAVKDFIENNIDTIALLSVSDVQGVLQIFRSMYQERESQMVSLLQPNTSTSFTSKSEIFTRNSPKASQLSVRKTGLHFLKRATKKSVAEQTPREHLIEKTKKTRSLSPLSLKNKKNSKAFSKLIRKQLQKQLKGSKPDSPASAPSPPSPQTTSKVITNPNQHSKKVSGKRKRKKTSLSSSTKSADEENPVLNYLHLDVKDYGDIWNCFTKEENFKEKNESLKKSAKDYLKSSLSYQEIMAKVQHLGQILEHKRDYLFKVELYRNNKKYSWGRDEEMKIDEIELNLQNQLKVAKDNMSKIREEQVARQAEVKINLDEYHRIREDISQCFISFCRTKYNIHLGDGKEHLEDEKLSTEEKLKEPSVQFKPFEDVEEEKREKMFYSFQAEMNKLMNKNIRVID